MDNSEMEKAKNWCISLHEYAGRREDESDAFWKELIGNEKLLEEFVFYMNSRQLLCRYEIGGMNLADVMIWQIDHFKSELDRGKYDMQSNPDVMILCAFETMLKMTKNPQAFLNRYSQDTGTDYPGKY